FWQALGSPERSESHAAQTGRTRADARRSAGAGRCGAATAERNRQPRRIAARLAPRAWPPRRAAVPRRRAAACRLRARADRAERDDALGARAAAPPARRAA